MAQGTNLTFQEFILDIGNGVHDLSSDTIKVALLSAIPTITDANPSYGDWTECSNGGSYTTGGETLTGVTWSRSGNVSTLDATLNPSWAAAASSPTDIRAAVIYNDTSAGKEAIAFLDMTADGSTPLSMVSGPISITWGASGIATGTRTA